MYGEYKLGRGCRGQQFWYARVSGAVQTAWVRAVHKWQRRKRHGARNVRVDRIYDV